MSANADIILADHYQKTFELTLVTWEKRNQTFLLLLAVVGIATLLTFNVAQAQPLLVDLIADALDIEDTRRTELRGSFPYGLVQSILLMVVFYLTVILYHRTATIQRFYVYLANIETEIRQHIALPLGSKSFTRESDFYVANRPTLGRFVAASYIGMLGLLLLAFLGMRVYSDFSNGNLGTGIADVFLSIPTIVFFYAYARIS
ncbi:hypothetical protein [Methylomonas methanica]|uniref:Uncharacterized protein n=1 Tax=Methylomonas methanica TaxID=421 RepID=A0A177MLK3_METMH|nr:hypothetical protein [Methylomonas methanica]OAI06223.1 hypothetical protein A1332_01590 [Methylomonas methanica]